MKFISLTILLAVVASATPVAAGPVMATGNASFDISVTPLAGSTAALENLNLTLELASTADVTSSDGTTPGAGNGADTGLVKGPSGVQLGDGSHTFDLDNMFTAIALSAAGRGTADGVVTTAKSSVDVSLAITADPSHGSVSLRLNYSAEGGFFFGGSYAFIDGAGTAGGETFSGTAAASTALTLGDDVLASAAVSLDDNGEELGEAQLFHDFNLEPGESVTFDLSAMTQATATATAVPEPSSFLLLGMLGLVGAWRQRISKSNSN